MTALVPAHTLNLVELERLAEATRQALAEAMPANTRRAYEGDWRRFAGWAGLPADPAELEAPAPPEMVVAYVAHLATSGRRYSTIRRAVSSIARTHARRGFTNPTATPAVGEVLKAWRRKLGTERTPAQPVWEDDLRAMLAATPAEGARGLRDRAVLVVGFLGAFRRSELVGLDVEHVRVVGRGVELFVARSKTGQAFVKRLTRKAEAAVCPVRVLEAWLDAAGLTEGAVFRGVNRHGNLLGRLSDRGVARIVKAAAERAGLDPTGFSGHSLRRGAASSARANGAPRDAIERLGGWAPGSKVVDRYLEDADGWETGGYLLG